MTPRAADWPVNRGLPALTSPDQVPNPYETLGAHPDLVTRLWDELGANLPVDCRVVVCGTPALMHPTTGVVFAFAGGTHTYALRLPDRERGEAIGEPEWVFCGWFRGG